ncbi:hypothetical protein I552_5596 [Mycobacterium xenopi 3993]|nr:hypothetical protein I552_5596 [Mycobacterium xenopi 3993]
MTWLLAGLVAGILGGAVAWLISLVYTGLYTGGLINEVSTFAAFTALLVFLPGMGGVTLGRWLIDRHAPRRPSMGTARRTPTCSPPSMRTRHRPTAWPQLEQGNNPPSRRRPHLTRSRPSAPPGRRRSAVNAGQVAQGEQIALHAEPDDHPGGDRAQVGVVPKVLARIHIGDVHLDERCGQFGAGVAQRHRGVSQPPALRMTGSILSAA